MRSSKNMLLILSNSTNYDRGMLNFEIEKVVDLYKIPIIVTYTGCDYVLDSTIYASRWPKALKERIDNGTVKAIHMHLKKRQLCVL